MHEITYEFIKPRQEPFFEANGILNLLRYQLVVKL